MITQIEKTDTYGGDANYAWVRRWYCNEPMTDAQSIRLAKQLCGWTGGRCKKEAYGDMIRLTPPFPETCFITSDKSGQGIRIDRHGNQLEDNTP